MIRAEQVGTGVSVGEVRTDHMGGDPGGSDLVGQGLELVDAPGHQRDAVSTSGELSGERLPYPR